MSEIDNGTVVTGRVRLARNLSGYSFPSTLKDKNLTREIINRCHAALRRYANVTLYEMDKTPPLFAEELKERYIISEALRKNVFSGAVLAENSGNLSVMINEEDHVREQYLVVGGDLFAAYEELCKTDRWLEKNLGFCKSKTLGYITSCPTNLGTGLRASAMMFLPFLTKNAKIPSLLEIAKNRGLTVRGVFGEGSGADSCLYQVSNEVTLDRTPHEILEDVTIFVNELTDVEKRNREAYFADNTLDVTDRCFRALGILTACRKLSYFEMCSLFTDLKIGAMLSLYGVKEFSAIDHLLVTARPATLQNSMAEIDESVDNEHIDGFRAEYVRTNLKKLINC